MVALADISVPVQGSDSADAKEIAALLAEEKVELVPEDEKDKLHEMDSLTGQPRPDDILLYALPVRPGPLFCPDRLL